MNNDLAVLLLALGLLMIPLALGYMILYYVLVAIDADKGLWVMYWIYVPSSLLAAIFGKFISSD